MGNICFVRNGLKMNVLERGRLGYYKLWMVAGGSQAIKAPDKPCFQCIGGTNDPTVLHVCMCG
jgi:hypothetical protein